MSRNFRRSLLAVPFAVAGVGVTSASANVPDGVIFPQRHVNGIPTVTDTGGPRFNERVGSALATIDQRDASLPTADGGRPDGCLPKGTDGRASWRHG